MDNKQIKNVLYNYYAISRFEKEKHQNDKSSPFYLVSFYAEDMIKCLLNNAFDLVLYQDAYLMLEYLDIISSKDILKNNQETYQVLKDCYVLYDSKLLRKEDPIEYVFKALSLYLDHFNVYERKDDEVILKHRYDIIVNQMLENESYGSLFLKMTMTLINKFSVFVKELFSKYKNNILVDSLMMIKSLYHNLSINLLFKDEEMVKERLFIINQYLISLLMLFNEEKNNDLLVLKLDSFADYYFSINHQIKIKEQKIDQSNYQYPFGFLSDHLKVIDNVINIRVDNIYKYYLNTNKLLLNLFNVMQERFKEFKEINELEFNQVLTDIAILVQEMKVC